MKKTVKIFSFILFLLLFLPSISVLAKTDSVYDEADVLSNKEIIALEKKYNAVRDKYDIDVAIVFADDLYSYDIESSADDFYDYNGYGMGANDDGILLYVSIGTREYHFTTHAKASEAFNKNGLRYLDEEISPYWKDCDYYGAANRFAELSEELLEMAANGKPYNKKATSEIVITILIAVGISLIIAFVLTFAKLSQMKTATMQHSAKEYMKPGSMNMAYSRDIFLYSHIDRREKPKSNGGHTSSSGRTHTGRSGSF